MVHTRKRDYGSITHSSKNLKQDYNENEIIWKKGYKGFKNNLTANQNNFQFEIGQTYHYYPNIKPIELCKHGFHFCRKFHDVMEHYEFKFNNRYRYCEIEYDSRNGHVIHGEGYEYGKSVTSTIKIVRELTEEEIRELLKGKVDYELWRDEVTKEFHRDNDLPAKIYYYKNGRVEEEIWYSNGKLHRENDLPALIKYYENRNVKQEEWVINGLLHRENDLPALIRYHHNNGVIGIKMTEQWYNNDKLHRKNDLPALIKYYENRNVKQEEWVINGLRSRHRNNDLPAFIHYYKNGSVKQEEWWINGKKHRKNDLPAFIYYNIDGSVYDHALFVHGKRVHNGYVLLLIILTLLTLYSHMIHILIFI